MNRLDDGSNHGAVLMDTKALLTCFVTEELLDEEEPVGANESLLADGMLDSLAMMRLVAYIDHELGYKVPPGDLVIENFRTIALISASSCARSASTA